MAAPSQGDVSIADFHAYDDETKTLHEDVRIYGPQAPIVDGEPERRISQILEPEYAGVTDTHAYVSLQEANAIAVVDLATAEVTDVWPMGFIDRNVVPFDPSDRDPEDAPEFSLRTYEGVYGIPQPDTVEAFTVNGKDYIVTANEGDARDYDNYTEEARAKDLGDDGIPPACDDASFADQLDDANLGRLNITLEMGLNEDGTCYEELYHYGSRSLSILDGDTGEIVYDSGSEFEEVTGELLPDFFNSNHSESNMEGRSDDKGPEPEGLTVGVIDDRTYAFVGFERVGGIIVYDVTDPANSTYAGYVNNRDFSISMEDSVDAGTGEEDLLKAGDLGPEGLEFVSAAISPNGKDLLIVGNEVSGTTTFFEVELKETEEPAEPAPASAFTSPTAGTRPLLTQSSPMGGPAMKFSWATGTETVKIPSPCAAATPSTSTTPCAAERPTTSSSTGATATRFSLATGTTTARIRSRFAAATSSLSLTPSSPVLLMRSSTTARPPTRSSWATGTVTVKTPWSPSAARPTS
ncbi:choice-of-anchor I family protein [Flaviflexus ciconiae]|uniref:choice-of-anchor I family protein n=1 Tax=Flaviflexus ciconiae TaxID=2496867 RepID=UPI001D18135C|nr:choice-of-anchor I family protein [Flaviflexus ciconiae]